MSPAEYAAAEQVGLFRSAYTPGEMHVQPCTCCADGVVAFPRNLNNRPNAGMIVAHFFGPDALPNAHRFIDWHNAQQEEARD